MPTVLEYTPALASRPTAVAPNAYSVCFQARTQLLGSGRVFFVPTAMEVLRGLLTSAASGLAGVAAVGLGAALGVSPATSGRPSRAAGGHPR